jgi:hypothetical protein
MKLPTWCPVHQHFKWCQHNGGVKREDGSYGPGTDTALRNNVLKGQPCPTVK